MNVKKLMLNTLLMVAVALTPVSLSSCDNDNSSNSPDDPELQENEASGTITGAAEADIQPDDGIEVEIEQEDGGNGNTITTLSVSWEDAQDNQVEADVTSVGNNIGTGTYDILENLNNASSQFSTVYVEYEGTSWNSSGESGSVTITTNNENRVAGTIDDVTLDNPNPDDDAQVTINAEFNALKGNTNENENENESDSANIVNLTGDEQEDIKAGNEPQYLLVGGGTININWQGASDTANRVSIGIRGLNSTDSATLAAFDDADVQDPSNVPDQFVKLSVDYEGTEYKTVDRSGNVKVTTNTDTRIEGTINDIKLEGDNKTVTANGSFAVDK
jgi:hypothetical protein